MRAHCLWALLLLLLAPARAALEISAQWKPDSPEAIAAAVDAQAFQAGLRRDIGQVYDAAGLPDGGVSAALQGTILGGGTAPVATTTTTAAAQTTPPPPAQDANGVPTITIGAAVVAVVAFAALGLFTTNYRATAPAAREAKRGPELPFRIVRPRDK
jgi:hypothetical protein